MKFRQNSIFKSTVLIFCCLTIGCTVHISSSGIPTSIATLVKTPPPMATLAIETATPEIVPSPIESSAPFETQAATIAIPTQEPFPTSANGSSTPGEIATNEEEGLSTLKPVFFLNTGSSIIENQNFIAVDTDETCVYVNNGATLGLINPSIQKAGTSSSNANSQIYGLNSACLVRSSSRLRLENPKLNTNGTSANGVFALGQGAQLTIEGGTIETLSPSSSGVVVAGGATAELTNVQVSTRVQDSAGIVVGSGGGSLTIRSGTVNTSGSNSPCYLSWGTLFADGNTCAASAASIAEVDGTSTIAMRNVTAITSGLDNGILLYRSGQNQTLAGNTSFSAEGGTLNTRNLEAPLFYVTNTQAQVTLKDVEIITASGVLLQASGNESWGQIGANGATVSLSLSSMVVNGSINADQLSAVSLNLSSNTILTGAINQKRTARFISLTMDATSSWTLTGNSYVNRLLGVTSSGNTVQGIIGNGFTLYYDPIQSPSLGGNTFSLAGGGSLTPAN